MSEKPIVYKHTEDGKWRSRFKGRVFKFEEGKHEPGSGESPPPTVPSGAFKVIPKPLRRESDPQPESVIKPAVESEPIAAPLPEAPQAELAQSPQPEQTQTPEPKESSAFPPLCADATKAPPLTGDSATDPQPDAGKKAKMDIPVVELLVDSMLQMGEALGGPKAPKTGSSKGLSIETLRDQMVDSGKAAFPSMELEAGPKVTFFGCMGLYLFMCSQNERFRENTRPWWERVRDKAIMGWVNFRHGRKAKREAKRRAKEEAQKETPDA